MKNLVLASLICGVIAQLGTGCVIVGDDDGNNPPPPPPPPDARVPDAQPPGPGEFLVTWTLLGGEAQAAVPCPPNTVVRITADPNPAVAGDEDIYLYDCPEGVGFADGLPPGDYDVWVDLLDEDENRIAQSDAVIAEPLDFDESVPLDFSFSVDRARFSLTWTILEGGDLSTCEDVGADEVSLLLTIAGTMEEHEEFFSCSEGEGTTALLPIADAYVGSLSLLDNDEAIDVEPAENLLLEFGNQRKELGDFMFDLL